MILLKILEIEFEDDVEEKMLRKILETQNKNI